MLKGNLTVWMDKLKYMLKSKKLHKTSKQLNDMQDQFSFKNNKKISIQDQKTPKQKTITPPKELQTKTFIFQASSTPSMEVRFFEIAWLPFMR